MARLKLVEIAGEIASGQWISECAAQVAYGGLKAIATGDPRSVRSTEEFNGFYVEDLIFDPSISASEDQEARANEAAIVNGGVYVQFHFDRTIAVDDDKSFRIVNVVIPDFTSKLVRDSYGDVVVDDGMPKYDLNSVAQELFGYSTRKACE